eukprot:670554-Prymnesium_polylepis.1
MIASHASETRTCASPSRYVYTPAVVGRPIAPMACVSHAAISGVSASRSQPAATASASSSSLPPPPSAAAEATRAVRVGSTS